MKEPIKFKVQPLLSRKNGKIFGPMSPMCFANEMAEAADVKFNRLGRIWFDDERINQRREDGGLTGFDTLVIGTVYENDIWLSLWVDLGVGGLAIAMAYRSDNGEVTMTPAYRSEAFAVKISEEDAGVIFSFIFQHMEMISIKEE